MPTPPVIDASPRKIILRQTTPRPIVLKQGAITQTAPIATANTPGLVKPDGVTTTVLLDGTITVIGGGGGNATGNYFPLANDTTIKSGDTLINRNMSSFVHETGEPYDRAFYGISRRKEFNVGNGNTTSFETIGLTLSGPVIQTYQHVTGGEITQGTITAAGVQQRVRDEAGTYFKTGYITTDYRQMYIGFYEQGNGTFTPSEIQFSKRDGMLVFGNMQKRASQLPTSESSLYSHILNKGEMDQLYMKKVRAN